MHYEGMFVKTLTPTRGDQYHQHIHCSSLAARISEKKDIEVQCRQDLEEIS